MDEAFQAAAALGDAATPALIDALKRPEACTRATVLIARLGTKANAAVPALTAALGDANPEVRREVLFALASMGADAAPAQTAVVKALDDPEVRVRGNRGLRFGQHRNGGTGTRAKPAQGTGIERSGCAWPAPGRWYTFRSRADQVAASGFAGADAGTAKRKHRRAPRFGRGSGPLGQVGTNGRGRMKVAARDPDESVRKAALAALERMGAVVDSPSGSRHRG